jgi:hypothetical protein
LSNRLREQLHRVVPSLLTLCPAADEPWLWALLARAPAPTAAAQLPRAVLTRLLSTHGVRRFDADALRAVLRAPAFATPPGVRRAVQDHLAVLLPRLQLAHTQQRACATRMGALLDALAETEEHRDVAVLRSVPGIARKVSATMLAEASRLLAGRDYHAPRAQAGCAPITRQSGARRQVVMRYACNVRLRNAVHYWAQVAVQHDARSRAQYERLRARGASHARALRGVGDRLLTVLIAMLRTGTLYDPARRQAAPTAA